MNHQITDHQVTLKKELSPVIAELAKEAGMTSGAYLADLVEEISHEQVTPERVLTMRPHVITDKKTWKHAERVADELGYKGVGPLLEARLRERAAKR